jgi:hypothetical protein
MFTKLKAAIKVIKEIKNGEWIPHWNSFGNDYTTAYKKRTKPYTGPELWLGNGPLFCDVADACDSRNLKIKNVFYRSLIWWCAARKLYIYSMRHRDTELS